MKRFTICAVESSRSVIQEKEKARRSLAAPLIPRLSVTDSHTSDRFYRLPTATLQPRKLPCLKRKRSVVSTETNRERTSVFFTPKSLSPPTISSLQSSQKRDSGAAITELSERENNKRSKSGYKIRYLSIGEDKALLPYFPIDQSQETPSRLLRLRPRKTQDAIAANILFSWKNRWLRWNLINSICSTSRSLYCRIDSAVTRCDLSPFRWAVTLD